MVFLTATPEPDISGGNARRRRKQKEIENQGIATIPELGWVRQPYYGPLEKTENIGKRSEGQELGHLGRH